MIELKNIVKVYEPQKIRAVDSISLRIASGEICVLIGPSGCGKTTVLRMINRMIEATAGAILIDGEDIRGGTKEALRRRIGYVIQSIGLLPHMTVEQNIAIVPRLLKWERQRKYDRVTELLHLIGLEPSIYRAKYPHELSGGEAQRIGVARALAVSPNILLMDEPFGAVDPLRREALQNEFLNLQQTLKKTVIFVTHDLDEAIKLADTVALMHNGAIAQHDKPERLLAKPKNQFVTDFIGEGRALKRLGCFLIADFLQTAQTVALADSKKISLQQRNSNATHWLVDTHNRVCGLVKNGNGALQTIKLKPAALALKSHHSLRDALSRALGLGISGVPITNDDDQIIGEIRISDIEKTNQSGLTY